MADPISDQCYDLAVGLYACHDASIEDCGTIRQLVEGLENELLAARAEMRRLQGIIDDVESESGHSLFLNDEEHEPPHLPDHVRAIVQERDAARADLREAMELLRAYRTAWNTKEEWVPIDERADALLAKHKETP